MAPKSAIIVGSWWLTREVELSTARACLIQFEGEGRSLTATWLLPASKNDPAAFGASRTHGCCCGVEGFRGMCPAHLLLAHIAFLARAFPDHFHANGAPTPSLPLFPDRLGRVCSKSAVTATIAHAATLLGLSVRSADGLGRWTGHSLRVTGAQGLARAGIDTWAIQLMGRWGSDAVLGYIREAPLTLTGRLASDVARGMALDQVAQAVKGFGEQGQAQANPVAPAWQRSLPNLRTSPQMDNERHGTSFGQLESCGPTAGSHDE